MTNKRSAMNVEALSRVNMRDMLILQDTATTVMANLVRFHETDASADGVALEVASREALESAYGFERVDEEDRKPFVYQDGVAVIPIHGTLLNRCNWSWGFVTGYQFVRRMLKAALDDDDVESIVFDVDSPGGEAAGCFELAREIMLARRIKPSLAMVDALAASGGVALAVCATKVYAIPSARIGSIGVYRMHISYEENLKKAGIKVTFAQAGDFKTDGNPYEDLPDRVLDEWRESAGKTWDDFISLVAEARDMSEDDVRATQARVYRADEALAKGLINAVQTPTEAVAAFLAELADEPSFDDEQEDINMANPTGKEVSSGLTASDMDSIKQMISTGISTAVGALARSQAIKDHASSKGHVALGAKLAANDAISEAEAIEIIDAAAGVAAPTPKAKTGKAKVQAADDEDGDSEEGDEEGDDEGDEEDDAEAARVSRKQSRDNVNHFEKAMSGTRKPKVGGGKSKVQDTGDEPTSREKSNALLADHAAVTGADWSRKATDASKH